MEERKNPFRNIKFVLRPSTPLLKIAVILVIVLSMVALVALRWVQNSIFAQKEALRDQAAELEYENAELEQKIADLGSAQSIQQIAEEELGMVDPEAVIIEPTGE